MEICKLNILDLYIRQHLAVKTYQYSVSAFLLFNSKKDAFGRDQGLAPPRLVLSSPLKTVQHSRSCHKQIWNGYDVSVIKIVASNKTQNSLQVVFPHPTPYFYFNIKHKSDTKYFCPPDTLNFGHKWKVNQKGIVLYLSTQIGGNEFST